MKKVKSISAIIIAISMIFMLSGCEQITGIFGRGPGGGGSGGGSVPEADLSNIPYVEGVDFAYEIEYFNSTMFNTFYLNVGDSHTPTASVWADAGEDGHCFTTDESVAFVAKNGNVFAKGRGTAYVLIKGIGMYEVYKYIVE